MGLDHGAPSVPWGRRGALSLACAALCLSAAPTPAAAFCGFYVGSADSKLYNDATTVVLMREGTRTVLSMQNSYQGPLADFAMVVPVPVVLQGSDVRTLPPEVFDRVEQLTAPRLVETWEQDPCSARGDLGQRASSRSAARPGILRLA